jgi:hypothetical protein
MNLDQWVFYVLPTRILEKKVPDLKHIGLDALLRLGPREASYQSLQRTIEASVHIET